MTLLKKKRNYLQKTFVIGKKWENCGEIGKMFYERKTQPQELAIKS